jgi:hypothetical protein
MAKVEAWRSDFQRNDLAWSERKEAKLLLPFLNHAECKARRPCSKKVINELPMYRQFRKKRINVAHV